MIKGRLFVVQVVARSWASLMDRRMLLRCAIEQVVDFLVGRLRKIAVPKADRVERLGRPAQMTSSASDRNSSQVSGAPTGTATTIRSGPRCAGLRRRPALWSRSAKPSSTRMTVRPRTASRASPRSLHGHRSRTPSGKTCLTSSISPSVTRIASMVKTDRASCSGSMQSSPWNSCSIRARNCFLWRLAGACDSGPSPRSRSHASASGAAHQDAPLRPR